MQIRGVVILETLVVIIEISVVKTFKTLIATKGTSAAVTVLNTVKKDFLFCFELEQKDIVSISLVGSCEKKK